MISSNMYLGVEFSVYSKKNPRYVKNFLFEFFSGAICIPVEVRSIVPHQTPIQEYQYQRRLLRYHLNMISNNLRQLFMNKF